MGTANAVYTGPVEVTCANGTFGTGWDNSNSFFDGKGNIAALYCDIIQHSTYISDNLTDESLRYYQGVVPIQDTVTSTDETQTVQVQVSQETSTSPSSPQETVTPVSAPESGTAPSTSDSQTTNVESPQLPQQQETSSVVQETVTVDTSTIPTETQSVVTETQTSTSDTQTVVSLPTPIPVVEPQPLPMPIEPDVPSPSEPDPLILEETVEEYPVIEVPVVEEVPVVAEQLPAEEEQSVPPVDTEQDVPSLDDSQEQNVPTPEPLPEPVAVPAPTSQPDIAYESPVVVLANGVILTQEVAEQIELLQNPSELLSELFTNPAAVFAALGSVGADMSPEARQKSKDAVVQAVVVGSIITQAAGAAAYRRKP